MYFRYLRHFLLVFFLVFASSAFAKDKVQISEVMKISIYKEYKNKKIEFISIKKIANTKYSVIVKTDFGKDKIIINKMGKIFSISDNLEDLETEEGC